MGYYTYYTLTVNAPDERIQAILKAMHERHTIFNELFDLDYAVKQYKQDGYLQLECEAKWYENEHDMLQLARDFPDVTFTLEGDGEDPSDNWQCEYHYAELQGHRERYQHKVWGEWNAYLDET